MSARPTSLEHYYMFLRLPNLSPASSPASLDSIESPSSSSSRYSSPTHSEILDFPPRISQRTRNLEFLDELTTSFARLIDGRYRCKLKEREVREEVLDTLKNTFNDDQYRMDALDALEKQRMSLAWLNDKMTRIRDKQHWTRHPSPSTSQMMVVLDGSTSSRHSASAEVEGQIDFATSSNNADVRGRSIAANAFQSMVANFSLFSILGLLMDKFRELYFLSRELPPSLPVSTDADVSDLIQLRGPAYTIQRPTFVNENCPRTYLYATIPIFLTFISLIRLLPYYFW